MTVPASLARVLGKRPAKSVRAAASFAATVTSPQVDSATAARRLAHCETCEKVTRDDGKLYCDACSCPCWRLSELTTKLRWQAAQCPLGKF